MVNMLEEIQSGKTSLSVLFSILGGIFVISGGLSLFTMLVWHGSTLTIGGPWHMYTITYPYWLTVVMATISLLIGGLVISSSYKMYKEPRNRLWGLIIILGSLVSLFGVGVFGLGGILGLIGGIMGISRTRLEP